MANFLECCRTGQPPYCPVDLAYHVQTALQMATLAMRAGKTAKFDRAQEAIVI